MDNKVTTVFVLGAGASVEAGVPLMKDFLDVARDLLDSRKVENDREYFEHVFAARGDLQLAHSKCAALDLHNIESIYSIIEFAKILNRQFSSLAGVSVEALSHAMRRLIVRTIEECAKFDYFNHRVDCHKSIRDFADLAQYLWERSEPRHDVAIITFNYDICLDIDLVSRGLTPCYHLETRTRVENQISLLKLHGSLNWYRDGGAVRAENVRSLMEAAKTNLGRSTSLNPSVATNETLRASELLKEVTSTSDDPVIVPPTWNKGEHYASLSNVWSTAGEYLQRADNIYVMGYSLPESDYMFRSLFALGTMGSNPLSRFRVVDPSHLTAQRFEALLGPGAAGRYKHYKNTFAEGIEQVGLELSPKGNWRNKR